MKTSSAKLEEFFKVNSLVVNGDKIDNKLVPTGQILSNSFSGNFSSFLSTLKLSLSLLSKLIM